MNRFLRAAALAALVPLAGCASLKGLDVGGFTGGSGGGLKSMDFGKVAKGVNAVRKGMAEITPSEEHFIGRSVSAQILARYRPLADDRLNGYAQAVGQLVAGASTRPETFKGYHVQVLDSDEVNAFAAPGGFIFVTKGMLDRVRSEDELAAILAHEVGHVAAKHGLKAIQSGRLTEAFTILGSEAMSGADLGKLAGLFGGAVNDIVGKVVASGYSKEQEYEADKLGASFAAAAGYDANALKTFLSRLETKPGAGGLFKTHPPASKRVAQLKAYPSAEPAPEARRRRFEAAL